MINYVGKVMYVVICRLSPPVRVTAGGVPEKAFPDPHIGLCSCPPTKALILELIFLSPLLANKVYVSDRGLSSNEYAARYGLCIPRTYFPLKDHYAEKGFLSFVWRCPSVTCILYRTLKVSHLARALGEREKKVRISLP